VDNVDFTNTSGEPAGSTTTYTWVFSDGNNFTTKDVSKSFAGVGTYSVTLTALATNGCSDDVTETISIDESPKAAFYAADVCEGSDVQMQNATVGNNGNVSYMWDFGTAGTSTQKNPSVTLAAGTHTITLTASTPGGCEDVVTEDVTVTAVPSVSNVQVSSAAIGNGTMNVVATATNGASYVVLWGDGGRSTGTVSGGSISAQYEYLADGVYDVQVRVSNGACNSSSGGTANVTCTSLVDLSKGQLKAYPNPSTGVFYLDMTGIEGAAVVNVYSANGQLVQTVPVAALSNLTTLDLSHAAGGVYLVSVQAADGTYTARITLNK
jgi:hypothetical protein